MLDELVDVQKTQVLVWEYAINDRLGSTTGVAARSVPEMGAGMEGFLTSVVRLFVHAGKPVPPILLVYLWDAGKAFPNSSAWDAQEAVVPWWRQKGLEIIPVLVGNSVIPPNALDVLQVIYTYTHTQKSQAPFGPPERTPPSHMHG